jgi:uncharacterized protein YkwD
LCLVLALVAAACATGPSVTRDSPGTAATAATISPSQAAAESYSAGVAARPPTDPFAVRLKAELDRLMKGLGRSPLMGDARFDKVAHDIARLTADENVSASSVVTFLLAYYGVVEPEPSLIIVKGEQGSEAAAIADLGAQFGQIAVASTWRRVGIGVWRRGRAWTAVLALHERNLILDPLPRALPSRGQAMLSGEVLGVFRSPEVLVTSPRGGVVRLPTQVRGKTFRAELECSLGDGAYQVEVSAEDQRGPTVLANFPVYCGVAPPATLQVAADQVPQSSDPRVIEAQILDLMDRDRTANGLPPLVRDARLARVARSYSREMAESGDIGHFSQRSGNAVDRVRRGGISPMPTVVAENVGRGYSAADAERGFMASPGHRENILGRQVTHVGVGVVMGKREGNTTPVFVTQIFAGWGQ